jgi:hypothetical protein
VLCGQIFAFDDASCISWQICVLNCDKSLVLNVVRTSVSSRSSTSVTGLWLDRVIFRLGRHNLPGIAT